MKVPSIIGLAVIIIVGSCSQQTTKGERQNEEGINNQYGQESGLRIEYKINRGTGYTDSSGTKINIRYIPLTITNDSTIPIRFQLDFFKEYEFIGKYGYQKFKVIPLPERWALDGLDISDSMFVELPKNIDSPSLIKTLEQNEKFVFAIGTVYNAVNYGPVPNALFSQNDRRDYVECGSHANQDESNNPNLFLELKIDFYHWMQPKDSCVIIPCGLISYLE